MKHFLKTTVTLLTAALLCAALMTGCTRLTEAKDNTPSTTGTPSAAGEFGVYVKLERDDANSVYIHGGSFSKVCENANGSPLKAGEWIFTGEDLVELSRKDHCAVLFTVGATDANDTLLGEGTFLYDESQEKLYVTIGADGVTCSTSDATDAPADVPPVLTLPILDEIDADVTVGTAGSSLLAVQAAVKLLDWGVNTGLDTDEIGTAASVWLSAKNEDRTECLQKLELVDDAYQKLLTDEARELLDDAGCAEVEITWGSEPVEPVEAIMRSAGLRDADSGDDAAWDVAGFEKSLLENYGVTPHHYEDLGDGVYQVYVEIDGEIVPFVTVDSATGDYHG